MLLTICKKEVISKQKGVIGKQKGVIMYPIYYKAKLKGWDKMSQEERLEVREELEFLNEDGTAVGFIVDGYLVGKIVDVCDEYIALEWWMPIDSYEETQDPLTTFKDGKWYNPSQRDEMNEWIEKKRRLGK